MATKREINYRKAGERECKRKFPITGESLCVNCGSQKLVDHHHLDGDPCNNDPDNVVIICRKCHLRLHRKNRDVGRRTRLTAEDIAGIKVSKLSKWELARAYEISPSYANRIRSGKKNPAPVRQGFVVPPGWKPRARGKRRSLTYAQVRVIRKAKTLSVKRCLELARRYNCCRATIWKARSKTGCYSEREKGTN